MADPRSVAQEIERLEALDLDGLRVQFRNRTGRIVPARLSRSLLLRVLVYRIQADVFGDLRPDTRRMLDKLGAAGAVGGEPDPKGPSAPPPGTARPKRGTVLAREWQGRMEHVMVLDDGFAWGGTTYASLSAVATAMTGTKWNGRRFFGLNRQASAPSPTGEQTSNKRGARSRTADLQRDGGAGTGGSGRTRRYLPGGATP